MIRVRLKRAAPPDVVAPEVDQHDVLGAFLA
jgi:hypothetical protein